MKKFIATAALLLGLIVAPEITNAGEVTKAEEVFDTGVKDSAIVDSSAYIIDGTIYKTDLEAGCFYLDSAGAKYMLVGSDEMLNKVLKFGADVELKVVPDPDAVTACMLGPALRVVDVIKVEREIRPSSDYKPITKADVSI